jgi:hypothetical protein
MSIAFCILAILVLGVITYFGITKLIIPASNNWIRASASFIAALLWFLLIRTLVILLMKP